MDDLTGYFPEIDEADGCGIDAPVAIESDERRLHVRAYNHWVSLLKGRAFPSIDDIDPAALGEFSRHGVLLDFTANRRDPAIRYLGPQLRAECGIDEAIETVGAVPRRSLLSRLTDHYLQIIASRSPVGFDAEFVNQRGLNTLYRGILMPFSSNGVTIDFIYGVINWKELADEQLASELLLQVDEALRRTPVASAQASLWADGPNAAGGLDFAFDLPEERAPHAEEAGTGCDGLTFVEDDGVELDLSARLGLARGLAEEARSADGRSRGALYQALGQAHDFALQAAGQPQAYAALLAEAGIKAQDRAPMTAVAKLVFGADYDKARLTEFAAVLDHTRRSGVPAGEGAAYIEAKGGLKAIVAAARAERRGTPAEIDWEEVRVTLLASIQIGQADVAGSDEFVLLLGRRGDGEKVEVLAPVGDRAMIQRAMRRWAA